MFIACFRADIPLRSAFHFRPRTVCNEVAAIESLEPSFEALIAQPTCLLNEGADRVERLDFPHFEWIVVGHRVPIVRDARGESGNGALPWTKAGREHVSARSHGMGPFKSGC